MHCTVRFRPCQCNAVMTMSTLRPCAVLRAGLGAEPGRLQPHTVAQALALLLMILAVNSALTAIHGLQAACKQSAGDCERLYNSRAVRRLCEAL